MNGFDHYALILISHNKIIRKLSLKKDNHMLDKAT
jgi:hypothetical protein